MAKKPSEKPYPRELKTIGDHIRKRRLDLSLLQKDVAEMLHVDTTTVYNWENNKTAPPTRFLPKILQFLEYSPFTTGARETLGQTIKAYRLTHGLSQKKTAEVLGFDPATLSRLEKDERRCFPSVLTKVSALLHFEDGY